MITQSIHVCFNKRECFIFHIFHIFHVFHIFHIFHVFHVCFCAWHLKHLAPETKQHLKQLMGDFEYFSWGVVQYLAES